MSVRTLAHACRRGPLGVTVVCVAAAAAYLVIGLVRDDLVLAIACPAIMLGYAAVLFALARRSEPLALLAGTVHDERQAQVLQRATAATGQALAIVLVVGWLVSLAVDSRYAAVFGYLCAFGGATFAVATVWYSRRG